MRIGYSLTTSEIVAADHADYGDCAKFQITCPRCREAVFKGRRTHSGAETHYFSHYHAMSDEARECEMRVAALAHKYLATFAIEGHGQTLGQFMAVLRETVVQGQAEMGIVPYATLWRDAQRIAARSDFGIFEKPFRMMTDGKIRDKVIQANPTFNARDDLTCLINKMPPFRERSLFWCRRQASYVLDILTHIVTPQAERNFSFVAACAYSVMFRSPESYPSPDEERDSQFSGKIARALVEGWSPAKLHELILSRIDKPSREVSAITQKRGEDDVAIYSGLMGFSGPPKNKAALLSSAVGAPFMEMARIPNNIVQQAFDIRTKELQSRLNDTREELYGHAEELAVMTLCINAFTPFYGLLAGIPLRSVVGESL